MMNELVAGFEPITLDEMNTIRLMNRTDTKFLTSRQKLQQILLMAQGRYRMQEVLGERLSAYYTLYFDTPDHAMYRAHESGRAVRQKVRIRQYIRSGSNFLEIKTKNNHHRTLKQRIGIDEISLIDRACDDFLNRYCWYAPQTLKPVLANRFRRITLVNNEKTERLTIDMDLQFENLTNLHCCTLGNLVVIELKRDSLVPSPILDITNRLRIHPRGFSKYCMGAALTDELLKQNRLKPRIRGLIRMIDSE